MTDETGHVGFVCGAYQIDDDARGWPDATYLVQWGFFGLLTLWSFTHGAYTLRD